MADRVNKPKFGKPRDLRELAGNLERYLGGPHLHLGKIRLSGEGDRVYVEVEEGGVYRRLGRVAMEVEE